MNNLCHPIDIFMAKEKKDMFMK